MFDQAELSDGRRERGVPAHGAHGAQPRVVTTGRKVEQPGYGVDADTGETLSLSVRGSRLHATRQLAPDESASASVAFIDALAFSVVPPEGAGYVWVLAEMSKFLDFGAVEPRGGLFGFQRSARLGDGVGVIAWGGESQRGIVYFSLMGQGCSRVKNWHGLAAWLEAHRATIKRADVAHDDFDGDVVSIDWAVAQYRDGGFNAGGRRPRSECLGDWLDGNEAIRGRTLGIGNRDSGKYARCYEKGKQLGDGQSRWTRIEVEWRAQDRFIPFDILVRPGFYLAGAYPCLAFISAEQSVIKTISKSVQVSFECAVENAKQHCGKLINLMLRVFEGDCGEVVHRLVRDGLPGRVEPFSYHITADPGLCVGGAS
jgi:phage replication initiation protein